MEQAARSDRKMFEVNHPYTKDLVLLKELGLPVWEAPIHEEKFIGEVFPYPEHEEPKGRTKLRVFVQCHPAQFYRFEIERRSEDDGYDGMESVEVTTGSGSLSEHWPIALAVAGHMVSVSIPTRIDTLQEVASS